MVHALYPSKAQRAETAAQWKYNFSSWRNFHDHVLLLVPPAEFVNIPKEDRRLFNPDLKPTPPDTRTWTWVHYAAFWGAYSMNTTTWSSASSIVQLGMKWWQAWLALVIAHIISIIIIVYNGRAGARYHVGFPAVVRASFGVYGGYFAVVVRAIASIVWAAVQIYYGGQLLGCVIRAIWPSWYHIPNTLPKSAGITSKNLAGFTLFWFMSMVLNCFKPHTLKWFYVVKAFTMTTACFCVLAWAMIKNHGATFPYEKDISLAGPTLAWTWIKAFNTGFGACASLTVNQADIARYARRPSDQFWSQIVAYSIFSALPMLFGILVSSACKVFWGTAYWNLWDFFNAMMDHYTDSASRFAIFLGSTAFTLGILGSSIATNVLPFGSDMTALFPKYINLVRGQMLCTILSFAFCPWKILVSATAFISFLNGYGFFCAPLTAIMIIDYFIVKNGNYSTVDLYKTYGRYRYYKGVNWRAIAAFCLAIVPPMPGFVGSINSRYLISVAATHIYTIAFPVSFASAILIYLALYLVFPESPDTRIDAAFETIPDTWDGEYDSADRTSSAVEGVLGSGEKDLESEVKINEA